MVTEAKSIFQWMIYLAEKEVVVVHKEDLSQRLKCYQYSYWSNTSVTLVLYILPEILNQCYTLFILAGIFCMEDAMKKNKKCKNEYINNKKINVKILRGINEYGNIKTKAKAMGKSKK